MSTSVPSEISKDILSIIPIKSLARFRLVSKSWRSIIDDILLEQSSLGINARILLWPFSATSDAIIQSIDHETLLKSPDDTVIGTTSTTHVRMTEIFREYYWDSTTESESWSIQAVGSCNGLICLVARQSFAFDDIIIWNPLTRIYMKIIAPFGKTRKEYLYKPYFGYDVSSGDYKVMIVLHNFFIPHFRRYQVYSLRYQTWKTLNSTPLHAYYFNALEPSGQTLLNTSLYWIVRRKGLVNGVEAEQSPVYTTVILAFDLAEEKFWEIPLPNCLTMKNIYFSCFPCIFLAVLDGQLCLYGRQDDYINNVDHTELWVMKECGGKESWVPWISLTDVHIFRPLCMSREKQIVALIDENKLVTYDLMKGKLREIKSVEGDGAFGIVYGESLISPNLLSSSPLHGQKGKH